jgi:two-component system KDP operon response regulator KdpE
VSAGEAPAGRPPRVLVVDDEPQILRALKVVLREAGFEAVPAATGTEALDLAAVRPPEAAIVDLVLPDGDGVEVTRRLREWSEMPILVLSAVGEEEQKVRALEAGADDYITKPFSFDELLARIRAALRRSGFATDTAPRKISVPGLEIDFEERRVIAGGKAVRLTPTEFDILRYLAARANKPVPHRRLLQAIWGPEYGDQVEYLRVFINQLRKKIEPPGEKPVFITTDPRIGYRFAVPGVAAVVGES